MNLRLKFALLFAGTVTVILIISGIITLLLFEDHRRDDLNKRLRAQAYLNFHEWASPDNSVSQLPPDVREHLPGSLPNLTLQIIDSNYALIFHQPQKNTTEYDYKIYDQIRSEKEHYFKLSNGVEAAGVWVRKDQHPYYVIVTAYDRYGKRKLAFLQFALLGVVVFGVLLSFGASYFYLKAVSRPLRSLNDQIRDLNAADLQQRIPVPRNMDALGEFIENFNAMLERLERSFELQKTFVHHASHELRTPLAVMLAQTESALGRDLTMEEAIGVLRSLREDQQEMIELTNSLLLLSQYEKISYLHDWPLVRIDELIYDNVAMVKKMYEDMNVTLEFVSLPDNEEDLSIRGNEALIRSAVRNLIRNAYAYSSDKQVSITIDASEENVTVHFDNHGNQLATEEQERLFLPFFRGQNAQTKKGFGLGLSIVQRIMNIHKGSIRYQAVGDDLNRFSLIFDRRA